MARASIEQVLGAILALGLTLTLYGCGTGSGNSTASGSLAQKSDISISGSKAGVTPFVASVQFTGQNISDLTFVTFSIAAMPNSVSAPVTVVWSVAQLTARGYLQPNAINLPVFGLYDGYQNEVSFQLMFNDGSAQKLQLQIATQPYTDPSGVYLSPTVIQARAPGSYLGFNFFIMKSQLGSPVIIDTDGRVRWVVPADQTMSVYYTNGQFVTGSEAGPVATVLQFDGTQSTLQTNLPQPLLNVFTHNIDPGPIGYLAEFSGTDSIGTSLLDTVAEIMPSSTEPPNQTFDMAQILTNYMTAHGDDPTLFVRPGIDWFHVNSSVYDPSDNTIIISSREDFLIKLNYTTHEIVWILGDPTKYWYTFPSLRAKALTLAAGGDYPIGQHAISINADGSLMVSNDGYGSTNQPNGAPTGLTRSFSEVSAYSVDATKMTAQNLWNFNYNQTIFSPICGSSYQAGASYLVDFAAADNYTHARLIGLDANRNVVFDFQYGSPGKCDAAWNAIPIPMENLLIR